MRGAGGGLGRRTRDSYVPVAEFDFLRLQSNAVSNREDEMAKFLCRRWTGSLVHPATIAALIAAGCGHGAPGVAAAANASAKLVKPVAMTINSGSCESDGEGTVGANFGNALAFNIGPKTGGASFLKMNTAPYKGPGTYTKVIISGYPQKGQTFFGLGTVVVNVDRRTGTFKTDDGKASGSWDCGEVLK